MSPCRWLVDYVSTSHLSRLITTAFQLLFVPLCNLDGARLCPLSACRAMWHDIVRKDIHQ